MRRAWVGPAVLWATGCLAPSGRSATPAATPGESGTTPTAAASGAAPAATASTPAQQDDPAHCIDTPVEFAKWDTEVEQRLDGALANLKSCTKAVTHSGQIEIWASFKDDGRPGAVRVTRGSVDDCKAVQCIERGLAGVGAPAVPRGKFPGVTRTVTLEAGTAPQLREATWLDGADKKLCLNEPEPGDDMPHGHLPPEQIQAIVRKHYGLFRRCYETGLARNPTLQGRISVRFVIGLDGRVQMANVAETAVPDCKVARCVREEFEKLEFPKPEGGTVTVLYPIMLEPG